MDKKTVGTKEGLGLGIVGLGLLMVFLPSASQQIADLEFVSSSAYTILFGTTYVMSVFIIIAGLAVTLAKFKDSEEE